MLLQSIQGEARRSSRAARSLRIRYGIAACSAFLGLAALGACRDPAPAPSSVSAGGSSSSTLPPALAVPQAPPLEANVISERLGVPVSRAASGSLSAVVPRSDVQWTLDGAPGQLEIGTRVTFRPSAGGARVSGSVIVLEDEVSPVLDTLLAHGLVMVGLYNRLSFEEPRLLKLRFVGEGNPGLLASGVQSIGSVLRDVRQRSPKPLRTLPGEAPERGRLDARALGAVLGVTAAEQGGAVQLDVPGAPSAGPDAEARLRATLVGSDIRAAIDGRFVLTPAELPGVLAALRRANIHVLALGPHGFEATPETLVLYFRGRGNSLALVRAMGHALEAKPAAQPG